MLASSTGYAAGTRYGIRMDADGLLAAGEPGVQLTWMDARVGDRWSRPRIGKPVEIQALWLNALRIAAPARVVLEARMYDAGVARSLSASGTSDAATCFDVVDVDHSPATRRAFRPNQILAVGGLPSR